MITSWGPGDKINKSIGLEGQGSASSGRRKFKPRKLRIDTKGVSMKLLAR